MKITLCSIFVDDQQKALDFYTGILGFIKSQEIPVGEFRWLTVKSPEGGETELSLEPNANPAARTYQEALFEQGIPFTAFEVDDIASEFQRLKHLGVTFTMEPTEAGPVTIAVFSDTCGNLIQVYQPQPTA
ncbi:MAG: VOC family protein [Pseudomonadales bacterium]|nr:VOC family protein [Pseudomonadales bacterium]